MMKIKEKVFIYITVFTIILSNNSSFFMNVYADDLSLDSEYFNVQDFEKTSENDVSTFQGKSADFLEDNLENNRLIIKSDSMVEPLDSEFMIEGYNDTYILQFDSQEAVEEAYNYYSELEDVKYVESDITFWTEECNSWGADNYSIDNNGINVNEFLEYNSTLLKENVIVAVLDSGIDKQHEVFEGRLTSNSFDYSSMYGYDTEHLLDENGHGTHVSSTISSCTSERISIMPIKVMVQDPRSGEVKGSASVIATGIYKAIEEGADVINLSIAGIGTSQTLNDAIKTATDNGVVVVTAAGNGDTSKNVRNVDEVCPANSPTVITVGSISKTGTYSLFANYGDGIDIVAPGENISGAMAGTISNYISKSGTSMATAYVSAAVALIKSYNSSLNYNEILEILQKSGTKSNFDNPICHYTKNNCEYSCPKLILSKSTIVNLDDHKPFNNVEDGVYIIESALKNNMVLDVYAASQSNGGNIQLYSSNGTEAQKFIIHNIGNGLYSIYSLNSGKVIDAKKTSLNSSENVQQNESLFSTSQKWKIVDAGNGCVNIINASSEKCLDVYAASVSNGTNIQLYSSNGTKAQKFVLKKQDCNAMISGEYYVVNNFKNNIALDVHSASTVSGANIQIYSKNNTNAQKFIFQHNDSGLYTIYNTNSNKVLDVYAGLKNNGTNIQQYTFNNTDAQKWILRKNIGGTYTFLNVGTGKALDIYAGNINSGTNVQQYTDNGTNAQKFKLIKCN